MEICVYYYNHGVSRASTASIINHRLDMLSEGQSLPTQYLAVA